MASRRVHNYVARLLTQASGKLIDQINKEIDQPYKVLGKKHRILYHSTNSTLLDSYLISHGKVERELIRQIHIMVDHNKKLGELLELYLSLKKR